MRINVKLDEVESGYTVYPDNNYHVIITDKTKVTKSQEGNPMIQWIAQIQDEEFKGKLIFWKTSLLPQALWNLKGLIEAIGLKWDEDGFNLEDTFDSELIVEVVTEEYDGTDRNKIDAYHSAGKAGTEPRKAADEPPF